MWNPPSKKTPKVLGPKNRSTVARVGWWGWGEMGEGGQKGVQSMETVVNTVSHTWKLLRIVLQSPQYKKKILAVYSDRCQPDLSWWLFPDADKYHTFCCAPGATIMLYVSKKSYYKFFSKKCNCKILVSPQKTYKDLKASPYVWFILGPCPTISQFDQII